MATVFMLFSVRAYIIVYLLYTVCIKKILKCTHFLSPALIWSLNNRSEFVILQFSQFKIINLYSVSMKPFN